MCIRDRAKGVRNDEVEGVFYPIQAILPWQLSIKKRGRQTLSFSPDYRLCQQPVSYTHLFDAGSADVINEHGDAGDVFERCAAESTADRGFGSLGHKESLT